MKPPGVQYVHPPFDSDLTMILVNTIFKLDSKDKAHPVTIDNMQEYSNVTTQDNFQDLGIDGIILAFTTRVTSSSVAPRAFN